MFQLVYQINLDITEIRYNGNKRALGNISSGQSLCDDDDKIQKSWVVSMIGNGNLEHSTRLVVSKAQQLSERFELEESSEPAIV